MIVLSALIVDVGIIGRFEKDPLLYIFAGRDVPDRSKNIEADHIRDKVIHLMYEEWKNQ